MKHLRGQGVKLFVGDSRETAKVIASSTSCDFALSANTVDASSKDDKNPLLDVAQFTNCSFTANNESFVTGIDELKILMAKILSGEPIFYAQFQVGDGSSLGNYSGNVILTKLEITATNGELVKLSLSFESTGEFSAGAMITSESPNFSKKLLGKSLMVCTRSGDNYNTFACAKSHKLSVSVQTSDVSDKDCNDLYIEKEVTGISITMSTENLIRTDTLRPRGLTAKYIAYIMQKGQEFTLAFGYYPDSIGKSIHNDEEKNQGWSTPSDAVFMGKFICTNISVNGSHKEESSYTAEFKCTEPLETALQAQNLSLENDECEIGAGEEATV